MYPFLRLGMITLPTYYLVISLGCLVAVLWFLRIARQRELPRIFAIDFALVSLASGFLGARLLHIFYEEPAYYAAQPLRAIEFWYGGFVYLGGLFGAALGALLFCYWRREAFLQWADVACIPASFAYAVGRIGCFLNGCCYGGHCTLPWAVFMDGDFRHPAQLYASGAEFVTLALLLFFANRLKITGTLFSLWLILHGLGRMLMEPFRDDPRGAPIFGLSLGTWMAAFLVLAGTFLWMSRPRQMGPDLQH